MSNGDPFQPAEEQLESAGIIEPSHEGKRRGQAVKPQGGAAEFVPHNAPYNPKPGTEGPKGKGAKKAREMIQRTGAQTFSPRAVVERLNVWKVNGKDCYLQMPKEGEQTTDSVPILNDTHLKRELRLERIWPTAISKSAPWSQQDIVIRYIVQNRRVEFAGSLAGYRTGIHMVAGQRMAITGSYRLIEPVEGEWPLINAFLDRFSRGAVDQRPYFLAWLKQAVTSLRAGERRPGHMLVLTGGTNSGKSFTQEYLITPLLGGRAADPRRYLVGESQFSGQIFGCEHLMMQELPSALDKTSRSMLSENLKQLIANDSMSLRAMYQEAVTVTPFRRVTLSMNDNVEKLQALPSLTSDFADKIIILILAGEPMPMPTHTDEQREAFRVALAAELPAFVHYLLNWEVPAELTAGEHAARFGLNAWQNPEIANAMFEMEPESKLLWFIDHSDLFTGGAWGWAPATDLQEEIARGPNGSKAERLFKYPGTCGELLGKLRIRFPDRFQKKHGKAGNLWMIHPA